MLQAACPHCISYWPLSIPCWQCQWCSPHWHSISHSVFCPPTMPKQECSCCCCSATTEDVANGTLTAAQECCTCLQEVGVCSPNCAACCGDGSKGCCCCGDGGCCCCGATSADAAAGKLTMRGLAAAVVGEQAFVPVLDVVVAAVAVAPVAARTSGRQTPCSLCQGEGIHGHSGSKSFRRYIYQFILVNSTANTFSFPYSFCFFFPEAFLTIIRTILHK